MIECEVKLKFDITYCRDDFDTEEEWQQFCEEKRNDKDFILDLLLGANYCTWDQEILEVTKWEVSED